MADQEQPKRRRRRLPPVTLLRPSEDLHQVPPDGLPPPTTGNRAVDAIYGFVDEDESRAVREAGLFNATFEILRSSRWLVALGTVGGLLELLLLLGTLAILCLPAAAGSGWLIATGSFTPFTLLAGGAVTILLMVVLRPFYVPLFAAVPQILFAAGVSAGLARVGGGQRDIRDLVADGYSAWSSLGRRALAVVMGAPGALYEALMVLVVPIRLAEGGSHEDAQRRSEELVARRWGPGRFRALGLPRMGPQWALYRYIALRFGFAAGRLFFPIAFLALFVGTVALSLITGWLVAVVFAALLLTMFTWTLGIQPTIDGLLRAHLYHYAVTGEAPAPYTRELLHSCLREEFRARLGMPQRVDGAAPAGGQTDAAPSTERAGVPGVVDRLGAGGLDYVEDEAGLDFDDLAGIGRDGLRLAKDARAVLRVVRDAGDRGLDQPSIAQAIGADVAATSATIGYLLKTRMLERTSGGDDVVRYRATTDRRL